MQVRRTFSASRAWRPTVGAGLTRTLGHAQMQRASTALIPTFRTRRPAMVSPAATRKSYRTAEDHAEPEGTATANSGTGFARASALDGLCHERPDVARGRDDEHSASRSLHRAKPARARMQLPCFQQRGARNTTRSFAPQAAVATWTAPCLHASRNSPPSQPRASAPAWPNPSLKRSANGRPPAPGRWYAVHFHRPGAGGLPLSPA